jgi:hypothetical protein
MSDRGPVFRLRLLSVTSNVERVGRLTPYMLETLLDAARCMSTGGWLDLAVSPDADPDCLADARRRFARLATRGVHVRVRSDPDLGLFRRELGPAAA